MTTPTLPSTTFEVQRVVTNEGLGDVIWTNHSVQFALADVTWRQLLEDITRAVFRARAAKRPIFAWLVTAGGSTRGVAHMDAITRVQHLLGMEVPTWDLTPAQAEELGKALLEASLEPEPCPVCKVRAIEEPSSLTTLTGCATCATRAGIG